EHPDMRARLLHVVRCEPAVESDRSVQALEDRVRRVPKSGHGESVSLEGDYQPAAIAPIWMTSMMPSRYRLTPHPASAPRLRGDRRVSGLRPIKRTTGNDAISPSAIRQKPLAPNAM